jgi:hypothetical protein
MRLPRGPLAEPLDVLAVLVAEKKLGRRVR